MDFPFIIGSKKRTSINKSTVINPYNDEPVAEIFLATESDIEEAIKTSHEAFSVTKNLPSYKRAEILERISENLSNRKTELAKLMTAESGKPITFSLSEIDRAIFTFKYASEEAKRIFGETIPLDLASHSEGRFGITKRFPIGPVLAITPFNFPLNLVAHKIAPAIAAGNSIVVKPAPQAPLLAIILGEIVLASGALPGMVNVITCSNDLAEKMVRDDRFKMLSFTGSANVGWYLKSIAGNKKVTLELGGNAGVIVDSLADFEFAIKRIVLGSFGQAGQSCIKVQRIYIDENNFDDFRIKFVNATKKVVYGDPMNPDTLVGPVIDETAALRIDNWITEGVNQGAKLLSGGKRNGLVFEPTILSDVKSDMKIFCEEIFGPVVTLHSFSDIKIAVREVNNTRYGLQTGIFSNNFSNIFYAFKNLDVGGLIVNDVPTYRIDNMPYGGIKDSGLGREGLKYAINDMTEEKLMVLNIF